MIVYSLHPSHMLCIVFQCSSIVDVQMFNLLDPIMSDVWTGLESHREALSRWCWQKPTG